MSYLLNISEESGWNYSDSKKEGYMPSITGTIVEISEVQSTNYMTKEKETWPDGKPKLNIKFTIQGQSGKELPWVFNPKSVAADAVKTALRQYDPNTMTMADLGGLMVRVTTQGDSNLYNVNNPRPWWFEILGPGTAEFRGVKEFEPMVTPQPQPQAQPQMQQQPVMQQQPPMQGNYYAPPQPQMQPQQQFTSPVNRLINPQAQQQQPQQQVPEPDYVPTSVYDDNDIPF